MAEVKLPKRSRRFGVGKEIGGDVYVHRDYAHVFPQDKLRAAQEKLPEGFDYQVVKYAAKTGDFSFLQSSDFDVANEPSIGNSVLVKPSGAVKFRKAETNPWIYHHKWLFVDDSYVGFDVEESKNRSIRWLSLEGIDFSRIGKKSYWTHNVLPRIDSEHLTLKEQ